MKKNYLFLIGVVLFTMVSVAGCSQSTNNSNSSNSTPPKDSTTPSTKTTPPKSTSSNAVSIENMAFSPDSLTVKKGTTVKWTNNDSTTHTVTGDSFDSGDLAPGKTFEHTFDKTGTFSYHCSIHSSMTGDVTVE